MNYALLIFITIAIVYLMSKKQPKTEPFSETVLEEPKIGKCKIQKTENELDDYIWGSLLGRHRACTYADVPTYELSDKIASAKDSLEQHLKVRDVTYQSSHQKDVIDTINNLYLEENGDIARGYKGKTIKEMYDQMTQGPTLYNRSSARIPKFDTYIAPGRYDENGEHLFSLKN